MPPPFPWLFSDTLTLAEKPLWGNSCLMVGADRSGQAARRHFESDDEMMGKERSRIAVRDREGYEQREQGRTLPLEFRESCKALAISRWFRALGMISFTFGEERSFGRGGKKEIDPTGCSTRPLRAFQRNSRISTCFLRLGLREETGKGAPRLSR